MRLSEPEMIAHGRPAMSLPDGWPSEEYDAMHETTDDMSTHPLRVEATFSRPGELVAALRAVKAGDDPRRTLALADALHERVADMLEGIVGLRYGARRPLVACIAMRDTLELLLDPDWPQPSDFTMTLRISALDAMAWEDERAAAAQGPEPQRRR